MEVRDSAREAVDCKVEEGVAVPHLLTSPETLGEPDIVTLPVLLIDLPTLLEGLGEGVPYKVPDTVGVNVTVEVGDAEYDGAAESEAPEDDVEDSEGKNVTL